jgi:hypothetical protein
MSEPDEYLGYLTGGISFVIWMLSSVFLMENFGLIGVMGLLALLCLSPGFITRKRDWFAWHFLGFLYGFIGVVGIAAIGALFAAVIN